MSAAVVGAAAQSVELGSQTAALCAVSIPYTAIAGNKLVAFVYTGLAPNPNVPFAPALTSPGLTPDRAGIFFDSAAQVQQLLTFSTDVTQTTQNVWTFAILGSFLSVLLVELTQVIPGPPNAGGLQIPLSVTTYPSPVIQSTRPSLCLSLFTIRNTNSGILVSQSYTNGTTLTDNANDLHVAGSRVQTNAGTTNDTLQLTTAQSGAAATLAFGLYPKIPPVNAVNKVCTVCGSTVFCGGPLCPNTGGLLPNSPDGLPQVSTPYISVAVKNPITGKLVPQVA